MKYSLRPQFFISVENKRENCILYECLNVLVSLYDEPHPRLSPLIPPAQQSPLPNPSHWIQACMGMSKFE